MGNPKRCSKAAPAHHLAGDRHLGGQDLSVGRIRDVERLAIGPAEGDVGQASRRRQNIGVGMSTA
jgi:hypothetical protein